jgi:putative sterol carrier protein
MSANVQDYFTALTTHHYEPLLHSVSGTIQWNIEGVGLWNMVINKGTITAGSNTMTPDSILSCNEDTFLSLVRGTQNHLTALLQGILVLEGNIGLAQVFQRIFEKQSDTNTNATNTRSKS